MRRVVVTGIGCLSPLGLTLDSTWTSVLENKTGVKYFPEWEEYQGFKTRLGAPLPEFELPEHFNHRATRSMGRVSLLSTLATEHALNDAKLFDSELIKNGSLGIAYGSGIASISGLANMVNFISNKSIKGINGTTYHRIMSHTCASNIGIFYGITGRILPTSSACTSGSLAIGLGYENIKYGLQNIMICGGAEEFSPAITAIFDVLCACTLDADHPESQPRPFDKSRSGIAIGEGACTLILEEYEHALKRGANILAEIKGFGTNSDGFHVTTPREDTIKTCMEIALKDASLKPQDISYINAHATGTGIGDLVESKATHSVFNNETPVSSLKGHLGHLLGASGAVELALTIKSLETGLLNPTKNLNDIDSECAKLDYITNGPRESKGEYAISNTFAFGGVNTSLILGKI